MPAPNLPLTGLARHLLNSGLLDQATLQQASLEAHQRDRALITSLIQQRLLSARQLAEQVAGLFGLPLQTLDALPAIDLPEHLQDEALSRRHRALPLCRRGSRLLVALSDPGCLPALQTLQFRSGLQIEPLLLDDDQLGQAIDRHFGRHDGGLASLEGSHEPTDADATSRTELSADEAPLARFIHHLLRDAVRRGASDLHFEPYESFYRVRFRIDGLLHEVSRPPQAQAARIAARLKVLAGLDIAERRRPQDGRIRLPLEGLTDIDLRINSLPTLWGEKIVMRILDQSSARRSIDDLGFDPDQQALYQQALQQPQGMILVTGPTGSGKTVSLYAGLNLLNTEDINIATAEDPVEINLPGINQVNVNPRQGLDFAQALRAFLRQDPDVLMVGEIRDLETAGIAIKAAQTGHRVLSTLHTNSAAETLTRLRNMGIPAVDIATSVSLIIAQRLVRRLCPHCKTPQTLPDNALREQGFAPQMQGSLHLYQPQGCPACQDGYRGRIGVYEVVRVTPALQQLILAGGNALELAAQARQEGFADLRQAGLAKAARGLTSLAEVNRLTLEAT
ncbi:type IV-A pilus assembly ATPase PilB [Pseudomonas sp. NW5]|uniref:type IV-A pilus assembly ATPase PilB n=1 Tax=Pseudomonas sp. NW5 TaxID=2934934 RepID=UPI002021E4A3|nr:type IV-A pilus assembly ATPase PilB [Pseudomonas sp. NW5]MCL7461240.1 type IV-A pilus assembly ATPase PilB [Pseudomonas sp. NW5]